MAQCYVQVLYIPLGSATCSTRRVALGWTIQQACPLAPIVTASYATHVMAIRRFTEACMKENLWINHKISLACRRVSFLGYSIGYDGINT